MPVIAEQTSGVEARHYQKLQDLCDYTSLTSLNPPNDKEVMQEILEAWIPDHYYLGEYRILVSAKEVLLLQYIKDLLVEADVIDGQWNVSIKIFEKTFHGLEKNMATVSVCCGVYISSPGRTFNIETVCTLYNDVDTVHFRDWELVEK